MLTTIKYFIGRRRVQSKTGTFPSLGAAIRAGRRGLRDIRIAWSMTGFRGPIRCAVTYGRTIVPMESRRLG